MVPGTSLQAVPVNSGPIDGQNDVVCIVQEETSFSKFHVNLPRSTSILDLYKKTAQEFGFEEDSFLLVWKSNKTGENNEIEETVLKDGIESLTLEDVCQPPEKKKQRFFLRPKDGTNPISIKRGTQEQGGNENDALADGSVSNMFESSSSSSTSSGSYHGPYTNTNSSYTDLTKSDTGYVGLVNQAMTCYLNSLLQTLFMTPEFRNAIYKWQFKDSKEEAEKSIPYQLQRLFVQLQFSSKRAVETTDVTKSFGWDSSDAWHQHDVQELCRVMFDALEKVFKDTDQATLINHLYQGKLKDYVKCLECASESARMDTYLDIPLVIRPFGANIPHESVEEAMDAFVNPETLEDNNQYKCDKCDKLCDAHKGLKFCSFPYLLTLQLKRFAFDYNLLHRVKLNDRMTFPKHLNLNKYISHDDDDNDESLSQKSDSPSSIETETDSGVSLTSSENDAVTEDELNDVSMDVTEKPMAACGGFDDAEESQSIQDLKGPEGPYMYELFSIMIHSGSAIGGHYYVYIRSFEDNQWYSFNDQTVSKISNSDIKRTFGSDASSRGYYSSTYSSSANAYMLMYRQIRSDNCVFMNEDELPDHVKKLVTKLHDDELKERELKDFKKSICRIKLFCRHPVKQELVDTKLEIHKDKTLRQTTEIARELFELENVVLLENCRIVKYDDFNENLELSYEGKEDTDISTILGGVQYSYLFDLMLEIKKDGEEFPVYKPGAITIKVHEVNVAQNSVAPAVSIRILWTDSLKTLQDLIRQKLQTSCKHVTMVWERYSSDFCQIKPSEKRTLRDENFFKKNKIFVECTDEEPSESLDSKLLEVLDNFSNSITLQVHLPNEVYTTAEGVLQIVIHKQTKLSEFKEMLESKMSCSAEMFKVFQVYSNNQEMEMDRLNDTFSIVPDKSKILIKYGRALKTDEFRTKVFLLRINELQEIMEFLLDTIFSKHMTILDAKKVLHDELKKSCKRDIPVERMRLRKKTWKSPGRIYRNDQILDDVVIYSGTFDLFVEELQGTEPKDNENQISLYVRRWRPSKYTFHEMQELVLSEEATVAELKAKISCNSEIVTDNIEIAKGRGSFPFEVSVLDVHNDLEWNLSGDVLRRYPIMINDDGAMFYYRDKTEQLMELSDEKRNEIRKAENARSSTNISKTSYKPKERALKIYTDR